MTREHSIATWCKRFQIDLWNLHDRMKAGELILYEKRGEDEVNVRIPVSPILHPIGVRKPRSGLGAQVCDAVIGFFYRMFRQIHLIFSGEKIQAMWAEKA